MDKNIKCPTGAKSTIRSIEGIIEITAFSVLYYFFWRHGYEEGIFPTYYGMGKYVLTGVYALLNIVLFFNFEGFKFGYLKLTDVVVSQWIALIIANFITFWQLCLIANVVITPLPLLQLTFAEMVITVVCCFAFTGIYHRLYVPKNMVMIYGKDAAFALMHKMNSRNDKYNISRLIPVEAGFDEIVRQIGSYDAVILTELPAEIRNDILKYCYQHRIRTYISPKISDIITRGALEINLFDTPLLLVRGQGLTPLQSLTKRLFDIVVCSVALVIASPVMLLVAIAIKLEDGGPVFYKQKRATLDGNVFDILKFRSMIPDAEKEGEFIPATDHDPRITKVGRFTRATRIDELPQLLNILKGDMSIVGPRPERLEHIRMYSERIPEFDLRLKVKGGLTGYAQIYGKYNTSPYDKLRLDLMYIENYSMLLDMKLILMTIRIMLKKESTEGFAEAAPAEEGSATELREEQPV